MSMQGARTNETIEVDEGARVYSFLILTNVKTLPITVACQSNDRCRMLQTAEYGPCMQCVLVLELQCGVIVMWWRACIAQWGVEN